MYIYIYIQSYNTPLDTCGTVTLKGYYYDNLLDASNKSSRSLANTVIGNFKVWYENTDILKRFPALKKVINPTRGGRSSTLFDTVAALIAIRTDWFICPIFNPPETYFSKLIMCFWII